MNDTTRSLLAVLFSSLFAAGCGGGGGGSGEDAAFGSSDPGQPVVVKLEEADLLGLYPTFHFTMMGLDSMTFLVASLGNPLLGEPFDPCQVGSIQSSQTAPDTHRVDLRDCGEDNVLEAPGVPRLEFHRRERGVLTFKLISTGGDFEGARQNFNIDFTEDFDDFQQFLQVQRGVEPPSSVRNILNGTQRLTYTGVNASMTRGTVDVRSERFEYKSESSGFGWAAVISDSHTSWKIEPDGMYRDANINLRMSAGPYSDKEIRLENVRPAWLPDTEPDATITSETAVAQVFATAQSGIDRMRYGVSQVFVVYAPDGLTLELDLDGDDCLDSKAVVSNQQLRDAMLNDIPLPRSLLTPYASCIAPPR